MQFPLGAYVDQLFFKNGHPLILCPKKYQQAYYVWHLENCLRGSLLYQHLEEKER